MVVLAVVRDQTQEAQREELPHLVKAMLVAVTLTMAQTTIGRVVVVVVRVLWVLLERQRLQEMVALDCNLQSMAQIIIGLAVAVQVCGQTKA
jgi:fumarate reductase subunit D